MTQYQDYQTPQYPLEPNFRNNNNALIMGAGSYTPVIILGGDNPEIKAVGVAEVFDCVGILLHHKSSGTALIYHMNEYDDKRFLLAFSGFANGFLPEEKKIKLLQSDTPDDVFNKIMSSGFAMNIKCTLTTSQERNIEKVLNALKRFGIPRESLAVEFENSQLLMDRKTGEVCKDFNLDESRYVSQEEKDREEQLRRKKESRDQQINSLKELSPQEKFEKFQEYGAITVRSPLITIDTEKLEEKLGIELFNSISDTDKQGIFNDILKYSKNLNITQVEVKMSPSYNNNLKIQSTPLHVINCLQDQSHITSLTIDSSSKLSYISHFSKKAAIALRINGKNLESVNITANTVKGTHFLNKHYSSNLSTNSVS